MVLVLHIQPGARTTAVAGPHGDALKIRLSAPPLEGRANAALIEFVASQLSVPRAAVSLVSGAASRHKRLRVAGVSAAAVLAVWAEPSGPGQR